MLDAALDDSSRLGPGWQDRGPPVLQQLADTEFDVDSFILSLAKDIIPDASQARLSEGRGKPERKHDFEKDGAAHHQLQGLIDRLEGALEQVLKLREDVSRRWESLEQEVQKEQKSFQGMVGRLEASHVRNAKQHFSELNDRMLEVASRATRIGDRLQVASYMQAQAREAERLLKALWQFSLLDLSDETFRGLPAEYRSDQAIAKTAKLAALTDEAIQAKKQNILATKPLEGPMHSSHSKARYGTIEQAAHGLRRYSDRMVRGVVERFERAAGQSGRRDVGALRACAQDMACLGKQKYLVQSYLASRPLFLETDSWLLSRGGAAFEASAAEQILANLATLFRKLQAAVKEEVALFQKVFDEADKAIAELLQRVFEQKVLCALQEALTLPSPDAPADELHAYLQMVIDIHARTLAFARQIAHNLKAEIGIQEHVDELALLVQKHYMSAELLWLQRKHEEKWRPGAGAAGGEGEAAGAAKVAGGSVLSLELVQDLLDWHAQAVARCVKLAKPGQVAHPVRRLWYCPEDDGGHDGRLLEQLGMHVMASMELLLARLSGSSPVGMSTKGSGRLRRSDIAAASQTIVTASFGMVLDTCKAATQAMKLLQSHFLANVKPHLPGSGSELQSCTLGLVCLVSFTRQQLQKALQTAVARFMLQVEQLLLAEQQRSDFRVTMQDEASQFEEPTPACLLVCGLVSTLQQQAQHALSAGNAQSVLAEVGGSLCVLLKVHMQRYTYTLLGALQWKRDISEYSDTVSPFGVPAVTDSINNLQQVANLLVVGADNLLGLVDSGLRMEHSEALTYISLREDYRTAKVEGRTLQSLFS